MSTFESVWASSAVLKRKIDPVWSALIFAFTKTLAALAMGLFGGLMVQLLARVPFMRTPLREDIGNGGCSGAKVRTPKPILWSFWRENERAAKVAGDGSFISIFTAAWIGGLFEQSMAQGAGMAFLVAGGVTSIPAAIAVFALVRLPVFFLYLSLALAGSVSIGLSYQMRVT